MRQSRSLVFLASLCAFIVGGAWAGVNSWTFHGPQGGGGATGPVAVHPTNSSIVLTGTNRGIFRSSNGGASWTLVKNDTSNFSSAMVFDPSNPNRAVASDAYFYLSEDAGQTFAVAQGPTAFNQIQRLAFGTNGTLYAAVHPGRLFRTAAPFSSWTEITTVPWPTDTFIQMLAVDPTDHQVFYVAVDNLGLYRTANGGQTWTGPLNTGVTMPTTFMHLAFDPTDSTRLVLATGGGLFLSTNSGGSWSQRDYSQAYWVGFDAATPGALAALRYSEVARSVDNGLSWTSGAALRVNYTPTASFVPGSPGRLLISTFSGIAISTDGGASMNYSLAGLTGAMPREVVSSNDGTGTVLAAMSSGAADLFRRSGTAWAALPTQPLVSALPFNRQLTSIAVATGDSRQIFAVSLAYQLIRTFDGGATWTAPHPAFSMNPSDYITDLQFDHGNPQVAYVARVTTGLWKTSNSGTTFTQLATSPAYANSVGVSPHDPMTLYVGGAMSHPGNGIWKSTNGGVSWTEQMPSSPTGNSVTSFAFHPIEPYTVYASNWSGVWRTTNGGATWTAVTFPQSMGTTSATASAVLFDPLLPSTLTVVGSVAGPGLLRSVDSGATWENVPMSLTGAPTQFTSGVLDPVNPSVVIATTTSADIAEYQVAPNLELTASALPIPIPVSTNTSITYTITNRGPHASSASHVDITLPNWLTPTAPSNCATALVRLRCQFTALQVNQSVTLPLTLAVGATPADAQITAVLTGHEPDAATANNAVASGASSALVADVDVVLSGGATTFDHNQTSTVTATVSNAGPSPATATELTLQIPANLAASNIIAAQGTCTTAAATITCNLGALAVNASTTVTFTATGSTPGNGLVAATARIPGIDPDNSHGATRDFVVRAVADVGVTVADSADPVTAGGVFTYTATVSNAGPDAGAVSSSISVTGATVTSASVSGGTCTNTASSAACEITSLANGASAAITVNVTAITAGNATATATATFSGTDSVGTNNSATTSTTINAPPAPPSGGGGGGGRFDWLIAALLALLVARRARLAGSSARLC